MHKQALTGMLPEEILQEFRFDKKFRSIQIFKWISLGINSFEEMSNLGKELISFLKENAFLYSSSISKILKDTDGTIKLQITLDDGLAIETVLLTDNNERKTACVSCQAGCAMGCAFCQTGRLGFARNLKAAEIVEQFLFLEKKAGSLSNIVFMGMGEPMQNLNEIRKAINILTDKRGINLSGRRITISTCGLTKGIYDLADNGPHVRLAVSLTTADEELRSKIMPVNSGNPLKELKAAIAYYIKKTGKRVTLEAALLAGCNTGKDSAARMIDFAKGLDVNINLIPWNPVDGLPFKEPAAKEILHFVEMLKYAGLNVNLRTRRGRKIGGACGQLGKTLNRTMQNS